MIQTPTFSICVYCGSRNGNDAGHASAANTVGQWIGARGGQLVYGGGINGLMGVVAKACLAAGGTVVGIIPQALVEREVANHACTELIVVQTMHERKRLMAERADAFLALPGGIGTLEELFEVWAWQQLGYHNKPVGLLNTAGYYDGLLSFLSASVSAGFISAPQHQALMVGQQTEALLRDLVQAAGLNANQSRLHNI